jgi:hypothetical protein
MEQERGRGVERESDGSEEGGKEREGGGRRRREREKNARRLKMRKVNSEGCRFVTTLTPVPCCKFALGLLRAIASLF